MKVALITGGARRLGAEMARVLHQSDYHVVVHCHHSIAEAQQLAETLNKKRKDSARVISYDLSQFANSFELIKETIACWGQLDLLVNNASNFLSTPVDKITQTTWQSLIAVNLQAPFFLSQAAFSFLQKTKGNIVNIADIHGVIPMKNYAVYCIAKAGLIMATKSLAKEMAPFVRVNAVAPGAMLWPEGENALSMQQQEKLIAETYLKRCGQPQDIAQAVLYLSNASYVTGHILTVDGGRSVG